MLDLFKVNSRLFALVGIIAGLVANVLMVVLCNVHYNIFSFVLDMIFKVMLIGLTVISARKILFAIPALLALLCNFINFITLILNFEEIELYEIISASFNSILVMFIWGCLIVISALTAFNLPFSDILRRFVPVAMSAALGLYVYMVVYSFSGTFRYIGMGYASTEMIISNVCSLVGNLAFALYSISLSTWFQEELSGY